MAGVRRGFPRRVVVGVGPDPSLAVLDAAAAEADLRGLPLHLLAACPATGPGPRVCLTGLVRRACTAWPGLVVTARNVTGEPAPALTVASRGAALVVVGRSRTGDGLAAEVVSHALCPTLVVPPGGTGRGGQPVLVAVAVAAAPADEAAIGYATEAADLRHVPLVVARAWPGPDRVPAADATRALVTATAAAGLVVVGAAGGPPGRVVRVLIDRAACPVAVVGHPYR